MSVKKQIPSLCKLYSFYEEVPEDFLEENDVESYLYHNVFWQFRFPASKSAS